MHMYMRFSWHYPTGFRSFKLNLTNLTPYLAASFPKTTHSRSYAIGRPPLTPEELEKRKKEGENQKGEWASSKICNRSGVPRKNIAAI